MSALRAGAVSVCLLSMTFLLGASRLGLFTFEIPARIRWNWDPISAWGASVSDVGKVVPRNSCHVIGNLLTEEGHHDT